MENSTVNQSILTEEMVLDYADDYLEYKYYSWIETAIVLSEFVKILFILCMMGISSYLIYVVVKFKKLQNRTNYFILHFCVCYNIHCIFELIFTICFVFTEIILICTSMLLKHVALICCFMFSMALLFDWLLATFYINSKWFSWHIRYSKFLNAAIYLLGLAKISLSVGGCYGLGEFESFIIGNIFVYAAFFFTLFVLLIVFIIGKLRRNSASNKSDKISYAFTLASTTILLWIPTFAIQVIIVVFYRARFIPYWAAQLTYFLKWIPHFMSLGSPAVMLFLLKKHNKNFKMAFDILFKKSVKDYQNDDLDEDSEDEERSVEVKVAKNGHLSINIVTNNETAHLSNKKEFSESTSGNLL